MRFASNILIAVLVTEFTKIMRETLSNKGKERLDRSIKIKLFARIYKHNYSVLLSKQTGKKNRQYYQRMLLTNIYYIF